MTALPHDRLDPNADSLGKGANQITCLRPRAGLITLLRTFLPRSHSDSVQMRLTLIEDVSVCFIEPVNSTFSGVDIAQGDLYIEWDFWVHQPIPNLECFTQIGETRVSVIHSDHCADCLGK